MIGQRRAVVLASASGTRARILSEAGVAFERDPPDLDEAVIRSRMWDRGADVEAAARELARAKADEISPRHPGAFVVAADQILECEGVWFEKPSGREGVLNHLERLRGHTHRLVTASCVVTDSQPVWEVVDTAALSMRALSDDFIAAYARDAGPEILESVGAYRIEALGAQLFSRIDGDYFTVLGLPLLPLLEFMREAGVINR
ncbi:MAG: Maf family protein [Rhodospirillales bacterium]|nr:Maf family protein [Rhodospirillales bacterium]